MRVKILRKNGSSYIQLPEGFAAEEVELFQLRDQFYLISPILQQEKKAEKPKEEEKKLSEPEIAVLQKLMKIRFADRTPTHIEKSFSPLEQNVVRQLIKKNFIQVFFGKQYRKTGVYNISSEIYPYIERHISRQVAEKPSAPPQPPAYSELAKAGWLIISDLREAEQFSSQLKSSGFSANVKGIRGFDGRFYVATMRFLYSAYEKIKPLLQKKKEMHLSEISQLSGLEPEAAMVVLHILSESGEIIEKKRDLYCLA